MGPVESVALLGFGLLVGVYGTMVGIGGGFIIVPVLLLVYRASPAAASGTSLVVVFCNAVAGTVWFARQRRIDYRSGLWFAAATIPGAIIGAWATDYMPSQVFRIVFGLFLVLVALWLALRPPGARSAGVKTVTAQTDYEHSLQWRSEGNNRLARASLWLGVSLSVAVGFISSILGIGGGVIHVPLLVRVLRFPTHVATATSFFILGITALQGSAVHALLGHVLPVHALWLSLGVIVGAQIGAPISRRVRAIWLVRLLAVAMAFVGVRLIIV